MKTFNYTAREADGSVRRGSLAAHDRAAVVSELRAQGVVPLSLEEGVAKELTSRRSFVSRPLIVAAAVVVIGMVVIFEFWGAMIRKPTHPPVPSAPVGVPSKAAAPARVEAPKLPVKESSAPAVSPTMPAVKPGADAGVREGLTGQPPAEEASAPAAKKIPPRRRPGVRVVDKEGREIFKPRPEITNHTDRFLWAIVNPRGSGMIPVSTQLVKRDFEQALLTPVEHMPDDTPEEIAAKQGLEQLKQQMRVLMDEGHALEDIVLLMQRERNALVAYRQGVQQTLFQLVRAGRLEEAAVYQEAANQELSKENAAPITIPVKLIEIGEQAAADNEAGGNAP